MSRSDKQLSDEQSEFLADLLETTKEDIKKVTEETTGEVLKLPLIQDNNHKPKKVRANLTRLLTYYDDNLKDLFIYNEATHNIEIVEDRKIGLHTLKKGIFDETATIQIASYISNAYYLDYQNNQIADEVAAVALMKSYNPIKNFLTNALETKKDRDPFEIIRQYLNIEDSSYNRVVFDLFFRGAIARILEPGCQFDFCLDLVGPQGGRKTTFLQQVFMDWYTDQITTFNQRDDVGIMVQSWVVNDDELVATRAMTFGEIKKVITLSVVTYRPPYGRKTVSLPVDFVFSRTTNETEHLGDATGDRRFIGVEVGKTTAAHKKKMTDEDLRDIWGNYYASLLENPKLYFEEHEPEYALIEQEREKFKKVDEVTERLTWYLDQPIPKDFFGVNTTDYQRRGYYSDLMSTGVAYKTSRDREYKEVWQGTVTRDRVSVSDIINELFHDERRNPVLTRKIRLFFDNLPSWEQKRKIKFGKRETSGYKMKKRGRVKQK